MKILIDAHHTFGDLIQTLPMIKAIKEVKPETNVTVLIGSAADVDILKLSKCVDSFYVFNTRKRYCLRNFIVIFKLFLIGFDYGIAHVGINKKLAAVLLKLCRCKVTIGSTGGIGKIKFDKAINTADESHVIRKNLKLLTAIGIVYKGVPSIFDVKHDFNKDFKIGVCIGSGDFTYLGNSYNCKRLPIEFYNKLINKLIDYGYSVVLLGGEKEKNLLKYIDCLNKTDNLVGKLSLGDSVNELSKCNIVIGVDTGLMQAASALNVKTIWMMGPMDEKYSGPLINGVVMPNKIDCSPCNEEKRYFCKYRKCLVQYDPDEVFKYVLMLSGKYFG